MNKNYFLPLLRHRYLPISYFTTVTVPVHFKVVPDIPVLAGNGAGAGAGAKMKKKGEPKPEPQLTCIKLK